MSSWIAELPHKWERKTPFVAYQLNIWHDRETYADEQNYYTDVEEVIEILRNRTKNEDHIQIATIRKETIFRRNPKCEMSTSSPLIHYEKGRGVYL